MATNERTEKAINSALALPAEQRLAVMDAILASLSAPSVDHGPGEQSDEVSTAWKGEISKRMADIEGGSVKTVPAADAERMIRDHARPSI